MSHESDLTIQQLRQALDNATTQLHYAQQLLNSLSPDQVTSQVADRVEQLATPITEGNQQIVEGVFNGQNMVGADGKIYTVPANYASKSKLVEGDILKLTIRSDGSFIYKQIGPVERKRLVGTLIKDDHTSEYVVMVDGQSYKVITAAITYYKGEPGDEVIILTPEDGDSQYAAVENLIHQGSRHEYTAELMLPDGAAAELPIGDTAELPSGADAELPASI